MKSFLIFLALTIVVGTGCSKKVADEKVAQDVAQAMCAKIKECGPSAAMADTTCVMGLTTSFKTALGYTGKAGKVTESALNSCVSEIKALKCETFAEFKPPASCNFLKGSK